MDATLNSTENRVDDPAVLAREIALIRNRLDRFKNNLVYSLESKYIKLSWSSNDDWTLSKIEDLAQVISDLLDTLNQKETDLDSSETEIESLYNQLCESQLAYDYAKSLIDIQTKLREFNNLCANLSYYRAAQLAKEIRGLLAGVGCSHQEDLSIAEIFRGIEEEELGPLDFSNFSRTLAKWDAVVVFSVIESDERDKTVTLSVNENKRDVVEDVLKAMHVYDVSEENIARFANKFFTEIIKPCIEYHTEIKTKRNSLSINIQKNIRKNADQAICDVGKVLQFFHQTFRFNVTNEMGGDFIAQVGKIIAEDMVSHIAIEQLEKAVPSKRRDLPIYLGLVKNVNLFCTFLREIGFLLEENSTLSDYCDNVHEQIRNKMKGTYFARARKICSQEIHSVVEIEPKDNDETLAMDVTRKTEASTRLADASVRLMEISPNCCLFPRCQVSKHVLDLLKLIREIMDEAATGDYTETDQSHLYSLVTDIIDIYPQIVGIVHKKIIENLPQIPALVHNNCFYLAHEMVTIGFNYENQRFRFVELVPRLRESGVEVLDAHLWKQRDIIVGTLNNAGLSSLSDYDKLPETVEKHINQCLGQLSFLHSVWRDVLPANVCNRLLGNLSNVFIQEVICKVIKTKDIREQTADDLIKVFTVVVETIPSFFPEGEVHRFVKLWLKFTSIVRILSATLIEIDELWADGKGPLAMHFQPLELKSLIKALFQDTERRNALLTSIN